MLYLLIPTLRGDFVGEYSKIEEVEWSSSRMDIDGRRDERFLFERNDNEEDDEEVEDDDSDEDDRNDIVEEDREEE